MGCHFLLQRIKPTSLGSPALAGRFFTTSGNFQSNYTPIKKNNNNNKKKNFSSLVAGLWGNLEDPQEEYEAFNGGDTQQASGNGYLLGTV